MTGTLINVIAILIGGALGLIFGARIPEKLKDTVIAGIGLFTVAIGLQMFLKTENPLVVLGSLLMEVYWVNGGRLKMDFETLGAFSKAASRGTPNLIPIPNSCAAS
jgi:hypothetical protein